MFDDDGIGPWMSLDKHLDHNFVFTLTQIQPRDIWFDTSQGEMDRWAAGNFKFGPNSAQLFLVAVFDQLLFWYIGPVEFDGATISV